MSEPIKYWEVWHNESTEDSCPDWRLDWRIWAPDQVAALYLAHGLTRSKCPSEVTEIKE